jgi:deoxyribonuclease-4
MSIAGGVERAVERARSVEATALQIFLKNSNQWRGRPIDEAEAGRFRAAVAEAGFAPPVAHGSYLINLGSPDAGLAERSVEALVDELERAAQLGVVGVVLHPGAHMGEGEETGLARVADRLNRAIERTAGNRAMVYLETTAGQGSTLGWRFGHLAELLARAADPARVGICLDTCHVFAAGYGLRSAREVRATLAEFDRVVGLHRLRLIHVNDSKGAQGSRRDRHAHIGQGEIGEAGFAALLRDERLRVVPMILETPKGDDLAEDRMNLATLRRLACAEFRVPSSESRVNEELGTRNSKLGTRNSRLET